jgi:magnesium-transporting ATPase (P-type)
MARFRKYALLLMLGATILMYLCLSKFSRGMFTIWLWWTSALTVIEFLIDLACFISAFLWFRKNVPFREKLSLRLGTAAALVHAVRVLIYVIGRTGPWENFDMKPEFYHLQDTVNWFWVYFASTLSVLGILGVLIIWRIRIRNRNRNKVTDGEIS